MQNESNQSRRRRFVQFSLRSLLAATMLVAAYTAGWMSHRSWNRRNLAEAVSQAIQDANLRVRIESVEGTDVLITRGRKEDVDAAMPIIQSAEEAARQ